MADTTRASTEQTRAATSGAGVPVAGGTDPGDPERALPARAVGRGPVLDGVRGNGRPTDPDEMREEIERTRQRMSSTLDSIEDRLVRRKRELWARATFQGVRRTIASEPWRSLAVAFAAGYIVAAIRD
jgi:hypothetical protein